MLSMPRFALLQHDHPIVHWDFLIEDHDKLLAWRLERRPVPGEKIDALRLPDHRLIYLDYEGPISQNRGSVVREDRGECRVTANFASQLQMVLQGNWLIGEILIEEKEGKPFFLWKDQGFTGLDGAGA